CQVASCNAGWNNCDSQTANGCETPLNTNSNCGACGTACALANAVSTCSTGSCQIASCNGGFADCDGLAVDGCEIDDTNDASNCGACAHVCSANNGVASCVSSACQIACNSGHGDCDGSVTN